jgi:hypothetical protein
MKATSWLVKDLLAAHPGLNALIDIVGRLMQLYAL